MGFKYLIQKLREINRRSSERKVRSRDLVLGVAASHDRRSPVIFRDQMRPTHLAVMGLSGVGKSYLIEKLVRQDIQQGTGFVIFDVHGDLADRIVSYLAERTRGDDTLLSRIVIIEPFDRDTSIGFNPLEQVEGTSPFMQAQELAHILRSRWGADSFGARTEELLRIALYTLSAHNLTLLELVHLLSDATYRAHLTRSLLEPSVRDYWRGRYQRLSEPMKSAVREPLLTRVSAFLADPQVRDIVGQRKSTFTFRDAMARGLWVVINLSKGKLGENSALLGSLLFTKLELDVMARAGTPPHQRQLFAVYADELQNLASRNFATLVAEARKYKVALTAGNQFWSQLSPDMRAAMLSVGSRVFFRLHYHDAQELAGELDPRERQWYVSLLTRLPRGHAVFRTGEHDPVLFQVESIRQSDATEEEVALLKSNSAARFAISRGLISQDIEQRRAQRASLAISEKLDRSNKPLNSS